MKERRFSNRIIELLEEWFNTNIKSPYASMETKRELPLLSNLSVSNVDFWLKNTRKKIKANKPSKHLSPCRDPISESDQNL